MEESKEIKKTKKKKKGKKKKKSNKEEASPRETLKNFLNQAQPNQGEQWTDDLFPPNESSIVGNSSNNKDSFESQNRDIDLSEIEWKRASEIFPEPHLFEGEINTQNFINGKIGNPFYLSALSALCEYPGLITKMFITKEYNPDGFYSLILFIDGEYQIIFVDDYFPCLKGTNIPYFTKPNNFELWPMILEKAWAKINGGYGNSLIGWPNDIFRAFTGFCCEDLNHNEEPSERIFNIIKKAKENNGIVCSSSKNDEEIIDVGLIGGITYSVINVEEVEDDKNRKVCLLKLRNDLGKSEWNGDWCENSVYWNDHIKNQIPKEKMELKEGEFYICLKDFIRYFSRTDICHIIFDGFTKTFDFNNISDIIYPHIFNFFLHEKANVSISIVEKNWRYHRELKNISHPTSIIIAEYDPSMQKIKYITGHYESYDYAEKTRELNPGYYLVWAYKAMNQSEKPLPESMKVRFISGGEINIKYIGTDNNFDAAEQIIYHGVKFLKEDQIKNDEIFYDIASDFKRSGIGYRLIINPLKNVSQKWEIDTSLNGGYYLLSEFENPNLFNFKVYPNDFESILFIRDKKYGTFRLNIKNEVEQENCEEDQKREKKRREFDSFCLGDLASEEKLQSEKTPSLEELSKIEKYPEYDDNKVFIEKNKPKENVNLDFEEILKLQPQEGKDRLGFVKLDNEDGVYLGEADYATPQGRGCYIFKNDGQSWIGYFDKGEKGNYGKFYDKDGRLTYEGEYKHGERDGKGVYYYPNGSKYVGDFVRNKKEGNGVYYWDENTRWEGIWANDKMDGDGIYYEGEYSQPLKYDKGNVVS